MTPERYRQIKRVFQAAAEHDPAARPEFLAEACGGDRDLRREVEALLASDDRPARVLVDPVADIAAQLLATSSAAALSGLRIGPYEILREIGRGGMGVVLLGVRADDQFQRRVAIKVVKRSLDAADTDLTVARFRQERQILASLDHPNIARLLDGGLTRDGLPYLAMELIEGLPIHEYCSRRLLGVRGRLELFRTVCAAVHCAHQHLVVHRDLKPGNILVTAAGVPKLLDFGIAKLLEPQHFPQPIAATATGQRLMTPEYASPEQVCGQRIGTASDVYALGVVLYELLTGKHPHHRPDLPPRELERAICEVEPDRPSTALPSSEAALGRRLRGDLDNIVLMALRKEPHRRYGSAEQLAEDLRRHLEGLPVAARRDTWGYRASKFVRRNLAAVLAAALVLAGLLGAAAAAIWQAREAMAQRARAVKAQSAAEQASALLVDLFQVSDPFESSGETLTVRAALDRGMERITADLADQPAVQAQLMSRVGALYLNLGLYDSAEPLLEKALEIRRRELGEEHPEVATCLDKLGELAYLRGDYDAAEPHFRRALAIRRLTLGEERPEVAESLNNLAGLLFFRGRFAEAEPLMRQALAMRRRTLGGKTVEVAESLNNLAQLLYYQGAYEEAEAVFHEALELGREVLGGEHLYVARGRRNLAELHLARGELETAAALLDEALRIQRRELSPEHPEIGWSLARKGEILAGRGDARAGERLLRQGLAILERAVLPTDPRVLEARSALGGCLTALGRHTEAEGLLRDAHANLAAGFGEDDARTRRARARLDELAGVSLP